MDTVDPEELAHSWYGNYNIGVIISIPICFWHKWLPVLAKQNLFATANMFY